MKKWPTKKQIDAAIKDLESKPSSRPLSPNATAVEKAKHAICEQFVIYMQTKGLSQQDLARQLGIDKSLVSKMTHYHFEDFTMDRLIKYLSVLDPKLKIEIKAKVA